jgi:hypothetical protein
MAMKRASLRLALAVILAAGSAAVFSNTGSIRAYVINNWWNDATNIIMDDVFLPAATFSDPAQFQLSEWNEVDVTTNDHPFLINAAPQFSFGANDGDNTMGFLGEAGLNSEYGLSYVGALAWAACWSFGAGAMSECDVMLDPTLPWSLGPDDDEWFQSTVLHETGHVRGLAHYNANLSMQNSGTSKFLRDEILYMDDRVAVRQHASHVSERDIVMYPKWHDGALPQWMTVSPTNPRVGTTVNFNNLKVENRGTLAFGSLSFGIYFSTNDIISTGDTLVNTGTYGSFGTFSTSTFNWSGVVPSIPDCGPRWFGAIIDHTNAYAERYEGNNEIVFVNGNRNPVQFNVLLERDSQEPNDSFAAPRVIGLPFNNANLTVDQDLESDYYRFTLAALSRVTFTANFTHANGDVDMDLRNNANAIIGSSTGVGNSESITQDLAAGTYTLRVYGFNAGSCNRYSLAGSSVLLNPDIASSPLSHAYGNVNIGQSADRTFIISNTGNLNLNVTSTTLIGANAAEFSIQSGGGAFTLAPAATRNIVVRFTPASAGAKVATLRIQSNDPNENPLDLGLSGTGQVPPNLRITALTPPANVSPGQAIVIANTVNNNGGSGAGAFTVGLYLSTDNVCTTGDTFLTSRAIASLAAGASNAANTPATIPAATPLGARFICAIADTANTVFESNEGDNTAFRSVNVIPAVPTVNLRINGLDGAVVNTTGGMLLTLDIGPSTYAGNLDWYWTLTVGGTTVWVTLGGLSPVQTPLLTAVPGATTLTNATLLNITLPVGTVLGNGFQLRNGAAIVSQDSITANVVTTLTAGGGR